MVAKIKENIPISEGILQTVSLEDEHSLSFSFLIVAGQHFSAPPGYFEQPRPPQYPHSRSQQYSFSTSHCPSSFRLLYSSRIPFLQYAIAGFKTHKNSSLT